MKNIELLPSPLALHNCFLLQVVFWSLYHWRFSSIHPQHPPSKFCWLVGNCSSPVICTGAFQICLEFLYLVGCELFFFLKILLLGKNSLNAYIYLFRYCSCCCYCHSGISTVSFRYASNTILASYYYVHQDSNINFNNCL